jgi:drug/metabolite transporter (DMT)-like permease
MFSTLGWLRLSFQRYFDLTQMYMYLETPVPLSAWIWEDWAVLFSIGFAAFLAQCLLNASMFYSAAGPVALMRNLDIVCAFIWGMLWFDEIPLYLGATLIAGATGTVGVLKWLKKK